jgi:hypothetical protein
LIFDPDDFSYDDDRHEYRNASGAVRRSVTQCLKEAGAINYDGIPPAILENARRRGSNIHRFTEEFDRYGDIDETWLADDEVPYFEAWKKFRRESGFVIKQIEEPMLRPIAGIEVGGTPDRVGYFGKDIYVLDIKNTAAKHPAWALQLALYEMQLTQRSRCGYMGRISIQLKKNATYSLTTYEDITDAGAAIACVVLSEDPLDVDSEIALRNWKHNNKIAA